MKYIICPDNAPLEHFNKLSDAKKRAKELGLKFIRRFRTGKLGEPYETTPLKLKED